MDISQACHIKQGADLIIREGARLFIEQAKKFKLSEQRIAEFYVCVQEFYKASCTYILKKLPLSEDVLKHAEVANPRKQKDARFTSLKFFLDRFPVLLHPEASVTALQMEFTLYQCTDITEAMKETRVDAAWREISKLEEDGEPQFPFLPTVMLNILTIPHSSAHCERVFSLVRKTQTDFRANLGTDTLEALLVAKSRPGSALQRTYTEQELRGLKSAQAALKS